jgi:hypothetical protein
LLQFIKALTHKLIRELAMDLDEEYGRKRLMYKRCQRCYNSIALFYIVIFGMIAFAELYLGFLGGSFYTVLGAIISGAVLAAGFCGAYLHKDIFAVSAPVLTLLISTIVPLVAFVAPICVLCTVINVIANKKYHWLEQQDGFPYFNTRFRNQEIDTSQWNIKDPYTQTYEEIKNKDNNNGQMDEL